MEKRFVYADNAATTALSESVLNAMMPYLTEQYGNASGVYSIGRRARRAVETAREKTALALGCNPSEIFFTSGGTESDNWAIQGAFRAFGSAEKNHIITTAIEHHAVLRTCEELEKQGAVITYIKPDRNGVVSPDEIEKAVTDKTILVSVMYANNETGVIQPVSETGCLCRRRGVLFHTDAVQAAPHITIDAGSLNADFISVSAHKMHGPKGIGALYIRDGIKLPPLMFGGGQEKGKRPGTENTAAAVGFGQAMSDIFPGLEKRNSHLVQMRKRLAEGLERTGRVTVNGDMSRALPGHLNVSVKNADGEALLLMLDLKGICASAGSACTSGDSAPSHVLTAMGLTPQEALSSVRFSLDSSITAEDVDYIINIFSEVLKKV